MPFLYPSVMSDSKRLTCPIDPCVPEPLSARDVRGLGQCLLKERMKLSLREMMTLGFEG